MTKQKQPEALRLADELEAGNCSLRTVMHPAAAELRRLHQTDLSNKEWLEKTEWVQASIQPGELGRHRADTIKQRFDRLLAENKQLKATQYGSGRLQALRDQRDDLLSLLRIVRGKHGCGVLALPPADVARIDAAIAKTESAS